MRLSPLITTFVTLILAAALLGVAWYFLRPAGPLLRSAALSPGAITPNADGNSDVASITYDLSRPAYVSIYFVAAGGTRYNFREEKPRDSGEHSLLFSGVVEGFTLPGEQLDNRILRRVLPNGTYRWVIEARESPSAVSETASGDLTLSDADTALPEMRGFSVYPQTFSPNQDGIDDRTTINVYLVKQSDLHVTLIGQDGITFPIPEKQGAIKTGEVGLHTFDYEGGVDLGATPPPDGTYTVLAETSDAVGQRMQTSGKLTITEGGVPRADIVNADVAFSATTLVLGDTLVFTLTVENYGNAPIRTSGPPPGTIYDMTQNSNTLGWYEESGAWRVGIDCDTCIRDYPWRWAVGQPSDLQKIGEHWYLMPGHRATVTGGVRLTEIPDRNPLYFWAGLIHEDVEISPVNNRVDPHFITIEPKK
ncbi:MAG: hypothetical protein HY023_07425 [Chloroflexi bacterium]|nr:hypothetical protein [Chloroflexota bacterium]